jgi:hypothetical protein
MKISAERRRLAEDRAGRENWRRWGPYLSERQWGTVREDYSAGGSAWDYLPHDHARSRAYRWGEDGIAGFSDDQQYLCLSLALWNGKDPILKERLFGLTNSEGNHGEDVKELYYYLDATPSHSYLKMLYKYPQAAYPYSHLVEENRRRGTESAEFELLDTGLFDSDRYFDVFVEYAKAAPDEILMQITAHNRGPDSAPLTLLPQLCCRNTWSWKPDVIKPTLTARQGAVEVRHPDLGNFRLDFDSASTLLFCDNDTNRRRLFGIYESGGYFKDAFHEYLVQGKHDAVNPARTGTKVGALHELNVESGASMRIRLRLSPRQWPDRRSLLGLRRHLRRHLRRAPPRSRRILRRGTTADRRSRREARAAPGIRRDDLEQDVLLLLHRGMARGRPAAAGAAARAQTRPQSGLAAPLQRRCDLDAR